MEFNDEDKSEIPDQYHKGKYFSLQLKVLLKCCGTFKLEN